MKKYTHEAIINRPIEEVIELFIKPEYFTDWQPDLKDYEVYEGQPCTTGAKARLRYATNDGDSILLREIVQENGLPQFYKVRYDTDGVHLYQTNWFEDAGGGKTLYRVENQFNTEGLMTVVSWFQPNHFKKQGEKLVESFKEYAEARL